MKKRGVWLVCYLVVTSTLVSAVDMREPRHPLDGEALNQEPALHMSRRLVSNVQRALADKGFYRGPVDGLLGPQTREALRDFQRAHQLPVTGRLDEETTRQLGVRLEDEGREKEPPGVFDKIGGGLKSVGGAVAGGTVTAAKSTKEGVVAGAQATAEGATTAGKATAEGATVVGKKTGQASTKAARATAKGATSASQAVKGVFTKKRPDEEILYDIQDRFKQDPQIDPAHLDIGVTDGVVTLAMNQGTKSELNRAAAVAREVEGVRRVVIQWR
jgi:peptidoglycan hydrolase-like protein with peptidoglycan-binding domain